MSAYDWQPGDIAACWGTCETSRAISWGTSSPFGPRRLRFAPSHVAIAAERNGSMLWIESTSLCRHPCLIRHLHVRGVQAHLPEERIGDYVAAGGKVERYRLSAIDRLSSDESRTLSRILIRHFIGREVTYDTGGALLSGTRLFKLTRLFPGADLNEVFCSELVAAVLMRLGRMNRDNPTRYNPATLLRRLVRCGTYQFDRSWSSTKVA